MTMELLLKQANPEHANSGARTPDHVTMDLDPTIQQVPAETAHSANNDILDDVFGDGTEDLASHDHLGEHAVIRDISQLHHPSDMPRLQQEHTTAGYRDGITVAKASSIQSGFDEGFGLGATFGLKVGRLLGLLEGVSNATKEETLWNDARADLSIKSVFGENFWNADGTWKYDVDESSGDGETELLFSHIVDAHPLVKKWTAIVDEQMRQWGLVEQLPLLARRDDEDDRAKPLVVHARAKAVGQSQAETKAPNEALSW